MRARRTGSSRPELTSRVVVRLLGVVAIAAATVVAVPAISAHAVTASAAPSAPFVSDVSATGLGLAVSWEPNAAADVVTNYRVSAIPLSASPVGGCTPATKTVSAVASDSRILLSGLCARVLYTAQVKAVNDFGASSAGVFGLTVAPLIAQVAAAPAVTSIVPRDSAALVSWVAPTDNGGLPITSYTVAAVPAAAAAGVPATTTVVVGAKVRAATLTGLMNGKPYRVSVAASNAMGVSVAGTVQVTPTPASTPTPPEGLTAVPTGNGSIAVSWAPPLDDGGQPVTGYTVTWQQSTYSASTGLWSRVSGTTVNTASTASTSLNVTSEQFEQPTAAYLFTAAATNSIGTGAVATVPAGLCPTVTTTATTVVLSSASIAAIAQVNSSSVSWPNPTPAQVTSLKVGQVIVAGTGNTLAPAGFLRTITSIAGSGGKAGTKTTLTTKNAALPSVFNSGSLSTTMNPDASVSQPGAVTSSPVPRRPHFTPAVPGVSVIPNGSVGFSSTVTLSTDLTIDSLTVKGAVTVTPSVSVDAELSHGWLGIPDGVKVKTTGKITSQAQLSVSGKIQKRIELGKITGDPLTFTVGPIPVVVVPTASLFVVVSGEEATTVGVNVVVGADLSWDSSDPGTLKGDNLSRGPALTAGPFGAQASLTGLIGIGVQIAAQLYDAAGPTVTGELDLQVKMNLNPPVGTQWLQIGPQVKLQVGLDVDIFGYGAQLNFTVGVFTFPTYGIDTPPVSSYAISPQNPYAAPGGTIQFSAVRADGALVTRQWSLLGDVVGDTITANGLFTAGSAGNRMLTVSVRDATGAMGTSRVVVGTPFDAPGNPVATSNSDGSASVSWAVPAHSGGAAIANYTVITTPDTGPHTVTGTAVTIPGLPAGSTIAIYAINVNHAQSPAATTSVRNVLSGRTTAIAAGDARTCAVETDRSVRCWGNNYQGTLGDGTTTKRLTPIVTGEISTATAITAGTSHTCALLADHTARCWGDDARGELGDGTTGDANSRRPTPVAVNGITSAAALTAGNGYTCALLADRTIRCWGFDFYGQLGDGTTGDTNYSRLTPVAVSGISTATAITASGQFHTCALLADHTVRCWGADYDGELGDGFAGGYRSIPVAVKGITTATAIAGGPNHTCALLADHTVRCWGNAGSGQLGDGTTGDANYRRLSPVAVAGITTATAITAGDGFTCATLTDHTVRCWGSDYYGTLGDGTTGPSGGGGRLTAVTTVGITSATAVTAGTHHACALLADDTVRCWGSAYNGEVGDGTTGDSNGRRLNPVAVIGI